MSTLSSRPSGSVFVYQTYRGADTVQQLKVDGPVNDGDMFQYDMTTKSFKMIPKPVQFYNTLSSFPTAGFVGVLYIRTDTNKIYRWNGTTYVIF